MSSDHHRLRKYDRKKHAAEGNGPKWNRLADLYWRYWHKVNGGHASLWRVEA